MDLPTAQRLILLVGAGLFGACFGSFLNVVIYRLPLPDLRVSQPKRSFCPNCKRTLPWYENLPVLGWLFLRGKCAGCKSGISFRYPLVELLSALGLVFLFATRPWPEAAALSLFFLLLLAATFIDFDHLIIPHEITFGGAAAGLIAASLVPGLHGAELWWKGLLAAVLAAAAGFALLWTVVNLGKLAFGKRRESYDKPERWTISQPDPEQAPILKLGDVEIEWWDLFFRPTDRLEMTCPKARIGPKNFTDAQLIIREESIEVGGETISLEDVERMSGTTTEVVIPREAMGQGDIWFLMMIGTFTGWKGVLFTVAFASFFGTIAGTVPRLFGKSDWFNRIPFGPYLALAAGVWVVWGPSLVRWYLGMIGR